jgi:hypothetical protein
MIELREELNMNPDLVIVEPTIKFYKTNFENGYKEIDLEKLEEAKLTIKDKTGKTMSMCTQADDGMFYSSGKCLTQAGIFNTKDGEWTDPVPESIDGDGKSMQLVKKQIYLKSMTYNESHDCWGHKGKGLLDETSKSYGIKKLTGRLTPCEGSGYAQAKQRAVSKTTNTKADKSGQQIFLDAAGPYHETLGGNKYWSQAVDDKKRHGWDHFSSVKSKMAVFA